MSGTFFRKKGVVLIGVLFCTILWGSAFPCVKAGYPLFGVDSGDVGSQMIFAGVRFVIAGFMTIIVSLFCERESYGRGKWNLSAVGSVCLLALVQTFLQYLFYYIGMAYVAGVKAAILNGSAALWCVLLAALFYRNRLSLTKCVGLVLGMFGIVVVNLGKGSLGEGFSLGDIFMLISAVVSALGSLVSKEMSKKVTPVTLCGWQLLLGGGMLSLVGLCLGGRLDFSLAGVGGVGLLLYMSFISAAAFSVWTVLLKYNDMERITVFNFLIPVFGTLLSALILGESLWNPYILFSLPLVCVGIYLVQRR